MQIIKDNLGMVLITIISISYLYLSCNFIINLDEFNSLKLNEKGDFLAGVFSPLAFLWLVYGYLQQGRELKQNTESLRLQATELKNSVEEQKKLIKIPLYTTNFTEPLSYQDSAFLKLPTFP